MSVIKTYRPWIIYLPFYHRHFKKNFNVTYLVTINCNENVQ
jgi:hypothetical protein